MENRNYLNKYNWVWKLKLRYRKNMYENKNKYVTKEMCKIK